MMDKQTEINESAEIPKEVWEGIKPIGSQTGRTTVQGCNFQEVEKGATLPVLDEHVIILPARKPGQPLDFKRGVFSGVSCLYHKNLAGQFEVFAPHIGVVNSHHKTPQGFWPLVEYVQD